MLSTYLCVDNFLCSGIIRVVIFMPIMNETFIIPGLSETSTNEIKGQIRALYALKSQIDKRIEALNAAILLISGTATNEKFIENGKTSGLNGLRSKVESETWRTYLFYALSIRTYSYSELVRAAQASNPNLDPKKVETNVRDFLNDQYKKNELDREKKPNGRGYVYNIKKEVEMATS
jgi:hypothetical protein